VPAGVLLERLEELRLAEIGPQHVREGELGIGRLPEKEVADAELPAGADDEVGIGNPRGVEAGGEDLLRDLLGPDLSLRRIRGQAARRADDLVAPA